MLSRIFVLALFGAIAFSAQKKVTGAARGENQDLILEVTVYGDPESVKEVVGDDLGGHYIVAAVKVQPKYGKEISIDLDDFLLRTFKDGEKTNPLAPNQIAGRSALVLNQTKESLGENSEPKRGWSLGGMMGGGGGGTGSPGAKDPSAIKGTMQEADKDNPLKQVLEAKILPVGKVEKPISGLLYFPMEKQKLKDLQMVFGAKDTRIELHFK